MIQAQYDGHDCTLTNVVFDCDGVILQSNNLKSNAFADVLATEGHDLALVKTFVDWHKATGGVSRFHKFAHFFRDTLDLPDWKAQTEAACNAFGDRVSKGLLTCATLPGLETLLAQLTGAGVPLSINTGGAQAEIRQVLAARGLAAPFDVILGSPATKRDNMVSLVDLGFLVPGGVYLGDSKLDWELAQEFGMHFFYVAYESEWDDGAEITRATGGTVVQDLTEVHLVSQPLQLPENT